MAQMAQEELVREKCWLCHGKGYRDISVMPVYGCHDYDVSFEESRKLNGRVLECKRDGKVEDGRPCHYFSGAHSCLYHHMTDKDWTCGSCT